jgi:GTP-binding protein Era
LNRALLETVYQVAEDCDAALLLVDPLEGFGPDHAALLARLAARRKPVLVVATKQDLPAAAAARLPDLGPVAGVFRVSAETGKGIPELLDALVALLPEGPSLYPEDDLTDRPERFLVAEEVREAAFEALSQELPYEIAVEIESFDESRPDLVRIRAKLLVVRESQKRIVVGTGGEMVRRIGTRARHAIERRLGRRVHLELWVKVEPDWIQRPNRLKSLGYW